MRTTTRLLALLALIATAGTGHATEMIYGSWAPSTDPVAAGVSAFAEGVSSASNGALTVVPHHDGAVVDMRSVLGSIRDGVVDAGYIAGSIYQAELPIDTMITQYSALSGNPYVMSAASTQLNLLNCADCAAEVTANGIVPLAYTGTAPFYLMCSEPIADFGELVGASIRAASANLRLVQKIGATPVNTPTTEVLEVMQRGQVKCVIGSVFWLKAYSLWDTVKYVLDEPVGQYNNGMVLAMNQDFWNGLPELERNAVLDAIPGMITTAARASIEAADDVRRESIEKGVQWIAPSAKMKAFMEEWKSSERGAVEAWGKENGIGDPGAVLARFEEVVATWADLVAETDGDDVAYEALLAKRIYSDPGAFLFAN